MNSEIVMYQTEDGLTKMETTFDNDTVWLSIDHYNLDAIISVGYRVKSLRGTQFRIWASNFSSGGNSIENNDFKKLLMKTKK